MHRIIEWEAARSGAGISLAMTDAGGVRRKQPVKKIEAKGATIVAIAGDGNRFDLTRAYPGDTSADVAAIAGELINIEATEFDALDMPGGQPAAELVRKIRAVAASCLGQRP